MRAPTRALVVENIEAWVHILDGAARGAGASEIIICENLQMVKDALRSARFDIAILEVGLDPDDGLNLDGIKALEAIREVDGGDTRCVLITGWQGGDRMDIQAEAQHKFGVDWAYMKEKYEAHVVVAKLAELLEHSETRRLSQTRPMSDLSACVEPILFEGQLLTELSPFGGIQTLYSLTSRLLRFAIPVIAMHPDMPMKKGPNGVWVGVYWSRALATAIAVTLAPAVVYPDGKSSIPTDLGRLLSAGMVPALIASGRDDNVCGELWELPGLDRDKFPG